MHKKLQHKIRIKGKGQSKEQCIANALGKIQKEVIAEFGGIIIRIEPVNVEIVDAMEETYTERFLLFFFPRKRSQFVIEMDMEVDLFILETDKIIFREQKK